MKYLKLYEKFNDELQTIKDILLEVEDMGHKTKIDRLKNKGIRTDYNYILITKIYNDVVFNEIKDCLLRLKDYLGDSYVGFGIYYQPSEGGWNKNGTGWKDFNLTEDSYVDSPILSVFIKYRPCE